MRLHWAGSIEEKGKEKSSAQSNINLGTFEQLKLPFPSLAEQARIVARRYIIASLKREFASDNGTELNAVLPKMSPLNPQYLTKKQSVFQKIAAFVEKFKGVGGQV